MCRVQTSRQGLLWWFAEHYHLPALLFKYGFIKVLILIEHILIYLNGLIYITTGHKLNFIKVLKNDNMLLKYT